MINLLPEEHKSEVRAARTNVLLLRYIFISLVATTVLAFLIGGSYVVLNSTREVAQLKVDDNAAQVSRYQDARTEAEQFRSDLTTAKAILDNEITYSKLIYKIADAVPENTILNSLELDSANLGSSATMQASARTYEDAVRLKESFIENPELFSDVKFEDLSYSKEDSTYPVKINLSIVIIKEAL
jgi:hypothetical protein